MSGISVKEGKFISLQISMEQVHKAFQQMEKCVGTKTAESSHIEDILSLSYHVCPKIEPEMIEHRALIQTLYVGQYGGSVKEPEGFDLQEEFVTWKRDREEGMRLDMERGTK